MMGLEKVIRKLTPLLLASSLSLSNCGKGEENSNGSCQDDFDCPGEEYCVNGYCQGDYSNGSGSNGNNSGSEGQIIEEFSMGEVNYNEGITGSDGFLKFSDNNGGEAEIYVTDLEGNPLEGINVINYDGPDFEMFIAGDPSFNYAPELFLYNHNSTHALGLKSTDAWQFTTKKIKSDHPDYLAAKNSADWLMKAGTYTGCFSKETIDKKNEAYSTILSFGIFGKVGALVTYIVNKLDNVLEFASMVGYDAPEFDSYHEFAIKPKPGGNMFASVILELPFTKSAKDCEINNLDDDCNGKIDDCPSSNPNCEGLQCDTPVPKCYINSYYEYCGINIDGCYVGMLSPCPSGTYCKNKGEKIFCCNSDETTCYAVP